MLRSSLVRSLATCVAFSFVACVVSGGPGDRPNDGGGDGNGDGGTGTGSGGDDNGNGTGGTGVGLETGSGGDGNGNGTGGSVSTADCSSLPVCDDFEDGTVGSAPDPSVWSLRVNYNPATESPKIVIDDAEKHSGSKSLKVTATTDDQALGAFTTTGLPMDTIHLRVWMKAELEGVLTDPVFIGIGQGEGTEVRFRRFNGFVTANNTDADAVAPQGARESTVCPSCTPVPTDWFCLEMYVNRTSNELSLSVDGNVVVSVADWEGTNSAMPPSLDEVRLGFMRPNGSTGTVWFDDVAISPSPIGCD